jgi:isopropylmalate/homocitrate/citramalate synthase
LNAPWKTDKWWVSPLNFLEEVRDQVKLPEKVVFHDITLRDGEQQAGIVFTREDKALVARLLDEVGVQRIEAGMPAVSDEDKAAVEEIANSGLKAEVYCFARCMKRDVDLAYECGVDGVVMEIPASNHIIESAYKWPLEKAIQLPVEATMYAHEKGLKVTFFTIDSTRADLNWWFKIIETVGEQGHMDALVVVDTFGVCTPEAIKYFVGKARERMNKPIEIHCHNDFGLAAINTIAGLSAGAEVAHTTVNAIGERIGNAAFEEVALILEVLYGKRLGLKYEKLYELSKTVEKLSKVSMPPHKPIVGEGAFKVESGIVASWLLEVLDSNPMVLFPFHWSLVGQPPPQIVLGKKSGKDSIVYKLKQMNVTASDEVALKILMDVKLESIRLKRPLSDEEFQNIMKKYL